ncbi:MAG: hypothetical protein GX126_10105 [Bacteroidales bacterium]|nr:hypothetical protein [Bacteroidales bacterium]
MESGNEYDVSATGMTDPLTLPWVHKPTGEFTQYTFENKGVTHIYVQGDDNNTYQYQEYVSYGESGQNDAWMDVHGSLNNAAQGQLGDFNESDIEISGSENVITTSQLGDSNIAGIVLSGSDNCVAGIEQTGDFNDANILQSGVNNIAITVQQPLP